MITFPLIVSNDDLLLSSFLFLMYLFFNCFFFPFFFGHIFVKRFVNVEYCVTDQMLRMHSRSTYGPAVYRDNGRNMTGKVTVVFHQRNKDR